MGPTNPRETTLEDIRFHVARVVVDKRDGRVLARKMLESERAHGGAVVGTGENAVVVHEVKVVFVYGILFATGHHRDDVGIWCERQDGL